MTAVSFSTDNKLIATFSLEENTLRLWQPSGGIFGVLVGAFGMPGSGLGSQGPSGLASMKMFRSLNIGPPDTSISLFQLM